MRCSGGFITLNMDTPWTERCEHGTGRGLRLQRCVATRHLTAASLVGAPAYGQRGAGTTAATPIACTHSSLYSCTRSYRALLWLCVSTPAYVLPLPRATAAGGATCQQIYATSAWLGSSPLWRSLVRVFYLAISRVCALPAACNLGAAPSLRTLWQGWTLTCLYSPPFPDVAPGLQAY